MILFLTKKKAVKWKAAISNLSKILLPFQSPQTISFETEVHVANDENQVVEIGGYTCRRFYKHKMMSGNFMSLFEKRDGKYICIRETWALDMPKPENKKFKNKSIKHFNWSAFKLKF
jgi:hypothetical protein